MLRIFGRPRLPRKFPTLRYLPFFLLRLFQVATLRVKRIKHAMLRDLQAQRQRHFVPRALLSQTPTILLPLRRLKRHAGAGKFPSSAAAAQCPPLGFVPREDYVYASLLPLPRNVPPKDVVAKLESATAPLVDKQVLYSRYLYRFYVTDRARQRCELLDECLTNEELKKYKDWITCELTMEPDAFFKSQLIANSKKLIPQKETPFPSSGIAASVPTCTEPAGGLKLQFEKNEFTLAVRSASNSPASDGANGREPATLFDAAAEEKTSAETKKLLAMYHLREEDL